LKDTHTITKEQLETAKKQVEQAKLGLGIPKIVITRAKQILKQKEKDIYSNSKNALAQARIVATNFLDFVDKTFGISDKNKHANDRFEMYLAAKNTALKVKIETNWRKINSQYIKWKKQVDNIIERINNSKDVTADT